MTTQDLRLMTMERPPAGMGGMIESAAELFETAAKLKEEKSSWLSI